VLHLEVLPLDKQKLTRGYDLPALYVLHTVGPVGENEDKLTSCYNTCLNLVIKHNIKTVAFCGISTGIFGYPLYSASHVACRTIRKWMENPDNLAKVDRIIFCTFLAKEEVCYNELFPIYFPPARDPEFVAQYAVAKNNYTSEPESAETDEEEEDEDEDENEDEENNKNMVEVKSAPQPDLNQVDKTNKDTAPPLISGSSFVPSGLREIAITIPPNGFQSRWKTFHHHITPCGSFSRLYVKSKLNERQFIVATADENRNVDVHFDWVLLGSDS